ncbi:YeeE/YedE thiosulfate transporter family protein [Halonatronum saccharophilum]|uniref:YeeE/YedE thiosulfate transporter family protein n=1 Tax=Halonatronum saccharophilum TaxID=150060 RepID=UPI0004B07829|nr:YeeE/YedE thiosulfate transporter family protein [Halonatronum saccharophilum]
MKSFGIDSWDKGLLLLCIMALFIFIFNTEISIVLLLGLAVGFVIQRSNFCFSNGIMNFFLFKDTKLIKAIIILIGISTLGFSIYQYSLASGLSESSLNISPFGLYTVIGGLIFGIGMALAGGCASGILVRIGEGSSVFIIALIGLIIGSNLGFQHLSWWQERFGREAAFFPISFGWIGAMVIQFSILFIAYYILNDLDKQQ